MRERIYWIDNARAAAMISMVVYHTMWDLVYLYGVNAPWFHTTAAFYWQQSICWTFIILAGFCSRMTRNPLKQGIIVSFWGVVVMVVTGLFSPQSRVLFGVLTLIGSCSLFMIPLKKLLDKIPPLAGFICAALCFMLTYWTRRGYLSVFDVRLLELPDGLYSNLFTAYWGFPPAGFYSSDYFPIFPWIFLFLCGAFGYALWAKYRPKLLESCNVKIPGLTKLGRYALVVYVLHQPVIYGVLEVIFRAK